jgi:membrane associated rhomboid family serine protease
MTYPQPIGRLPAFGPRQWSVTMWLIAVNVGVFILDALAGGKLAEIGAFSVETAIHHFQVWRFLSFQFLHFGVMHILVNMIALYFFGPMVEGLLGKTRYLIFYLLCGLTGAAVFVALWRVGILDVNEFSRLEGASAGIFGVMIGAAMIAPRQQVQLLLFFVLPVAMKIRTLVIILLCMAVGAIVISGSNAGGEAAHLGGAAMGFVLMSFWKKKGPPRPAGHRYWKPGEDNFLRDEFRQ